MNDPHSASWLRDDDPAHDRTLEENWLFRLRRERFRSRTTGQAHDYYVLHLADAVNVIALTRDGNVVLVRQFRAGSGRDSLETPGGLLEPDEDPVEAGARELLEETGYAGVASGVLCTLWSVPSILTSRTTTILITDVDRIAAPRLDTSEEVTVELVPASSIPRLIKDGRIDHALVVSGLLWWLQSKFPGVLATAKPKRPLHIGEIMAAIAVVALCLGLVLNGATPLGATAAFVFILFIVFATAAATIWSSASQRTR